jgi:hypothetical protein
VAAGALPEAPQPEGLAVEMRGYQKQSLHFLLEAERREGGFRSLFWVPITNSQGQTYWFSPVWRKLALDVPAQPAGGFLGRSTAVSSVVTIAVVCVESVVCQMQRFTDEHLTEVWTCAWTCLRSPWGGSSCTCHLAVWPDWRCVVGPVPEGRCASHERRVHGCGDLA